MVICKIRKIKESDIPTLYEMLKESLSQKYTSVYDTKLPSFKQSSNYVKKFLKGSKNHEFEQWYVIINEKKEIMGQVFLQKKNYVGYTILRKYRNKGVATKGIKLLLSKHPRKKYYLIIHYHNKQSIHIAEKFGFIPKGLVFEKITKK